MKQTLSLKFKSLTKSDYCLGLECPGHLWLKYNNPSKIPPHPPGVLKRFEQGHIVGAFAKKLFPEGVDIPYPDTKGITKQLLSEKKVLFEVGLSFDNLYARADILVPVRNEVSEGSKNSQNFSEPVHGGWDIIEVKSSSSVKPEHYEDLAFQKYVYEKAGLKIRKCFLMCLNKEYGRKEEVNPKQLFVKEDITEKVEKLSSQVPKNIEFLWEIIKSPVFPNTAEKNHCTAPKDCLVKDECWGFLPESHVFHLYNSRKTMELFQKGIHSLADVPSDALSNAQQAIQLKCEKTKKVHIDHKSIKEFLSTITEPAAYLDFETCAFAVPEFQGTRPYQRLPFQFSLHVGKEHFEYLHDGKDDPRSSFLAALKKSLPLSGSVIVYSQGFEGSVLKELARDFPKYSEWIQSVIKRFVDLRVPFSKFWYYNPKQKGSASIKKVLPALVGKGYEGMAIADGDCATIAYLDMTFGKMTASMKQKTREDLLKYCGLDTEAMVWIVEELCMKEK